MKKLAVTEFEELLTKSNIEHTVKGDRGTTVDLDIMGMHMHVTNTHPIHDERLERVMVHIGYPKPAELLTLIFLLKIVELKCVIDGITFDELASEELERRGMISND